MKSPLTAFQDGDGNWSMSRCVFALVALSICGPLAYVTVRFHAFPEIPVGVRWIFGIAAGVKFGRQFGEGSPTGEPPQG